MDINGRIQQLEELITQAKSMPLSASVLVNREEVLELVQGMRDALPEEIKQARWVVKDREELLAKARRDAEGIVQEGQEEQDRLVAEQEVVKEAQREAERLLGEAREEARQIKLDAEDYVDAKLASFEIILTKAREELVKIEAQIARTHAQVEKGRQRLRGPTVAEEEFGGPDEDEEAEEVEG
jgi:cell division septum initiation protein DivIVA